MRVVRLKDFERQTDMLTEIELGPFLKCAFQLQIKISFMGDAYLNEQVRRRV